LLVVCRQEQRTSPYIDASKDLLPSHKIAAALFQKAAGKSDARVTDLESLAVLPAVEQSDALDRLDSKSDVRVSRPQMEVSAESLLDVQETLDNRLDVRDIHLHLSAVVVDRLDALPSEAESQSDVPDTLDSILDELELLAAVVHHLHLAEE
jgi:hypothetical protein